MRFQLQATVDLEVEVDSLESAADAATAALRGAQNRGVAVVDVYVPGTAY